MKKAVIFDLDGLLIDSEIISYKMYADLLQKHNLRFTLDTYARLTAAKTGVTNMQNLIFTYHLPISLEQGLAYVDALEKGYFAEGVPLKPAHGAAAFFETPRHQNPARLFQHAGARAVRAGGSTASRTALTRWFSVRKSRTANPRRISSSKRREKSGEASADCLVLEDSEAGIRAAYAAGIDVICVPDMKRPDGAFLSVAAAVLPSLLDVPLWLETH